MMTEVAVLADYASVSIGNKLNVSGIFDAITASKFPAVHPILYLVLRLRLEFDDGGKAHQLTVTMRDEDSGEFFKANADVQIPAIAPGSAIRLNQIMNFVGLQFATPGRYFFHVNWNNKEVAVITLDVKMGPQT